MVILVPSPTATLTQLLGSANLNSANTPRLTFLARTRPSPTVSIYLLGTTPLGNPGYISAGRVGTAKTSVTLPLLSADNAYIFVILAQVNPGANMESAPYRAKLPLAFCSVVSAPITIHPGATPTVRRAKN